MRSTHSNAKPLLSQRKYSRVPDARPRAWRGLPPVATLDGQRQDLVDGRLERDRLFFGHLCLDVEVSLLDGIVTVTVEGAAPEAESFAGL